MSLTKSDEDFFRAIREEIKMETAKMLEETEPSTEPLPDSSVPSNVSATDPSEIDGGFEFVSLTPAKKTDVKSSDKANKKPTLSLKVIEKTTKPSTKNLTALQNEVAKKLVKVKGLIKIKKEECLKLDSLKGQNPAKVVPESSEPMDDSNDESEVSNQKSQSTESNIQKKPAVNPAIQKKYDCAVDTVQIKMHEVKLKLRQLKLNSTESSSKIAPGKRSESTSTASSVSCSTKTKNQKAVAKVAVSKNDEKSQTSAYNKLSPEDKLLLTLLSLNSKQRGDYIHKIGKDRSFLVTDKEQRGSVEINPMWAPLTSELKSHALAYLHGSKAEQKAEDGITRPCLVNPNLDKIQDVKKVRQLRSFEDEVSYLLNNGKTTEKKDFKQELTLENVSQAEHNGFLTEQNKAALVQLVERLVADGVGYVVEGVLRVNGNNNAQAFVDDYTREADVFVNSVLLRKCAMEGDFVKVFVKHPDAKNTPDVGGEADATDSASQTNSIDEKSDGDGQLKLVALQEKVKNNAGFVIEILEKRHSRSCVGTFSPYQKANNQYLKFLPRDLRIPAMRVYKQHWPEAIFKNQFKEVESVIYQADIVDWIDDIPIGTIAKSIGKCGELEFENQAILIEYDLDVSPYSDAIINNLPPLPFKIPDSEIETRENMRDECVFTIDPLTARDLDDALSCKMLKNGNYMVGVHISDVSYFLQEGSELDELVKQRATSIYMVDNVYHMLPKPLCFLCSLLPGEDKMAFSVFWEITPDARVVSTRFARTVINSCCQLAYEHAQIMLDKPNENLNSDDFPTMHHGYTANYLSRIVNSLQSIAVQLRARRMENGCLKINQPKLCFTLDPNSGKPTAYDVYELRTANQMIEDFMLLANASVAEFCHSKFGDRAILRNHFPPSEIQMKNLAKMLAKHGHALRVDSSKSIAESLEAIISNCPQQDAARAALNVMIAKPMTRARYFCSAFASTEEEFYHYALAIPMYTHFTSPIRRYADCMVHRVLAAALELTEPTNRTTEELNKLTGICNIKKYNAKMAGDTSSMLYFKHYLKKVGCINTEAAVLDIGQHHLELVLIETGHVVKINHKRLAKCVDFKVTEESSQIRHCVLIPKDTNLPSAAVSLFSKVYVTVQLEKDAITITAISLLPLSNRVSKVRKHRTKKKSEDVGDARDSPVENSEH
ncbi:DIS3-like exonuclease 2 [Malaya genurostris]|uniref:DIS3-like exonuclease 2 n=1 Tax=Malaya genurostris TaxID=325434 RepID=UPI0026F3E770|nr:DIS3-like exonuclease 2 [Malaya genurostris]